MNSWLSWVKQFSFYPLELQITPLLLLIMTMITTTKTELQFKTVYTLLAVLTVVSNMNAHAATVQYLDHAKCISATRCRGTHQLLIWTELKFYSLIVCSGTIEGVGRKTWVLIENPLQQALKTQLTKLPEQNCDTLAGRWQCLYVNEFPSLSPCETSTHVHFSKLENPFVVISAVNQVFRLILLHTDFHFVLKQEFIWNILPPVTVSHSLSPFQVTQALWLLHSLKVIYWCQTPHSTPQTRIQITDGIAQKEKEGGERREREGGGGGVGGGEGGRER